MPKEADAMRPIQRAAVTGLFALWLAPLSLPPDSPRRSDGPDGRLGQAESVIADGGTAQPDRAPAER
jgi:hypothetical protein